MNRLFLTLLLLAACCTQAACSRPDRGLVHLNPIKTGNPNTDDRPLFHDFGNVKYGSRLDHTFLFENSSKHPIQIIRSQGACSCTLLASIETTRADGSIANGDPTANKDMLVVDAGAELRLKIRIDTTKVAANQHKLAVMRVNTDSEITPFLTFELHVYGEKAFRVEPAKVKLGSCPQSHGGSASVRVLPGGPDSFARVVGIVEQGRWVHAEIVEEEVNEQVYWIVHVELPEMLNFGPIQDKIVLSTTDGHGHGNSERLTIDVRGQVVPDITVFPRQLSFGAFNAGEQATLDGQVLALVPGARIKVLSAELEGPLAEHISVEYSAHRGDEGGSSDEWRFVMSVDASIPKGRFNGTLHIQLDDDQMPTLSAPFMGVAR
jgi:hypothetical protein